jgi:peptidoglycan DL-endopeptidase CwlO
VNFTARVTSRVCGGSRAKTMRRRLRLAALGLTSVALAGLFVFPASVPAVADPPVTVAEAKTLIEQLQTDAAGIDQQYTGVEEQITRGRAQLKLKQADVEAQADKVARMRLQVGQVALAQFQNRNLDTVAHLFVTPDTEGFLSQISTVQKVSENQNSVLQNYQQAQANLGALEHSAKTDLAALSEQEKQLKSLAAASDNKLEQAKKVLAKLTAAQRKQIADAEKEATAKANAEGRAATKAAPAKAKAEGRAATKAATAKAKAEGRAATKAATAKAKAEGQAATKAPRDSTRSSVTGSGKGAKALAFAKAQLGEPYARSGAGPSSWDCSGLTMKAWGSVGVSLPHSSRQQYSRGKIVAKSDLQLGDLVFFYSDIHHVGLYAGNGRVIHAPRPAKSVEYIKMSYMPYAGARRPG